MRRGLLALSAAGIMLTAGGAWAVADDGERHAVAGTDAPHSRHPSVVRAVLRDTNGDRVGMVSMRQRGAYVRVWANLYGLPPGFHGFHVHTTGDCDADHVGGPFMGAGGHFNPAGEAHGEHAGDLPSLYVTGSGWARLGFVTDAFRVSELRDADGSAVMVHGGRDNFANVPADRYTSVEGPVPDSETLRTGDAGPRIACGVID